MNSSQKPDIVPTTAPNKELDPDRIDRLLADLERELENSSPDNPTSQEIKQEIETLRAMVESRGANRGWSNEEHRSVRTSLHNLIERLEGEVLRDSPYIAEIGRILGLV
jgi:hypothetical protein